MNAAQILIVEDEGIIAADLEGQLRQLGYAVTGWASTGEEALGNIAAKKPDLVLMDIMLKGGMDGIEAAGQIQQHYDVPVIFLTAYFDETVIQRARLTKPFAYLLKPFNEHELQANIEMALYKHRIDKERERLLSELQQARREIKTLSGLLPICSHCKKIRDGENWQDIEVYIWKHSEAIFSHGICPECCEKYYPET